MYISRMPQNRLLFLQVAIKTMQQGHIATHIPGLITIEWCLGWETGPRTLKFSTFL